MKYLNSPNEILMMAQQIYHESFQKCIITSAEDCAGKTHFSKLLSNALLQYTSKDIIYFDLNRRNPTVIDGATPEGFPIDPQLKTVAPPLEFDSFNFNGKLDWIKDKVQEHASAAHIIIDTSPVNIFNKNNVHPIQLNFLDAKYFLIINRETTHRSEVLKCKQMLLSHSIEIHGAVLNQYAKTITKDRSSLTHWIEVVEKVRSLIHSVKGRINHG